MAGLADDVQTRFDQVYELLAANSDMIVRLREDMNKIQSRLDQVYELVAAHSNSIVRLREDMDKIKLKVDEIDGYID